MRHQNLTFTLILSLAFATFIATPKAANAADLTVRVDAREVARRHVHTDMVLAVQSGPLTLVFPKWIPGEHAPTGPLDSIIGMQIKANGQPLLWSRNAQNVFAVSVTVPHGATHLEISLDSGLSVSGDGFSASPTSSEQLAVLPWNEFVLLPKGRDAEHISTEASLIAPSGWHVVSALESTAQPDGSVRFESASLARLIDSPAQIGHYAKRFELAGTAPYPEIKHTLSVMADSEAALKVPDDFAAGYNNLVAEAGALFGTRMYRHYTWLLTLSDHVAHFGLEHHESSDNRRDENAFSEAMFRDGVAGLLGHEYVHSWNGKYRRPAGLLSADYQKPMDGSLLWVYEGLTEMWGDVLPTRAGLVSPEKYRDGLAFSAATFDVESGAHWRPLGDTAVAAQNLYQAPDAWESSRRGTDFYEASIFLWLAVDAELRSRTQGRASLDDFMKRFYEGAGGKPQLKPYAEADVYAALSAVAPADWRALIHRHLDATDTTALMEGLQSTGWTLSYSKEKNSYVDYVDKRRKGTSRQWSVGLRLNKDAEIIDVVENGPAARAGAGPGMTVIAVNGRKFSDEVLDAAISEAKDSHEPIEILVETNDFYRTLTVQYFAGPRFPHLMRVDNKSDGLAAILTSARH